ncbi:hypothetical protein [Halospeciosus flavus]|uniref:PH domain-containing protein n=1 Tax=Halospeciosus flavus TaxID=3032283 RepID=A0ABD5Z7D8_9EURY|nr:hypothetical protein [Halospeciosus flavus]
MGRNRYYHESRVLGPRLGWALLVVGAVLAAVLFAARDGPTTPVVFGSVVTALLSTVFWSVRITTSVEDDGVSVHVWPLGVFSQRISIDDLERYEVVGRDDAVRLERTDGRSTVLRTARPEELVAALDRVTDPERWS